MIGNPPWNRMKLQQVEWFATRRPEIAHAVRAADRKRMIADPRRRGDPLDAEFQRADERAGRAARVARTGGDYPLLASGDVNVMTNDSGRFRRRDELEETEGAWPVGGNRFDSPAGVWLPLYEGKMMQAFDHRAASVVTDPGRLHRPAQPEAATPEQHGDPAWLPVPQYWVAASACGWPPDTGWVLGFKEITSPTNVRTFIAALLPAVGFGNKIPILRPEPPSAANGCSPRT